MDEHTNTNPEADSNQASQEQQQNGQGNPPEQPNSQEQPQFQQYLNQEQAQQQQNPYQQSGQYQQQGPYQQYQPSPYQKPGQQNQYQQPYQQSPYQQNQYQQSSYQQTPPKQPNGMALASMIVGIFALLTCCIPFIQFPLAVIAIVLVILSKKGRPFHGFAIAGLVMAIISVLISIGMTFYWGYVIKLMNDPEFMSMYNEIMEMYQ